MSTVAEILGAKNKDGVLGIEIETESARRYNEPAIIGWNCITDGSLRDFGREYVSDGPIKPDDLGKSLKNWKDGLGAVHGMLRKDSISTSVHVHVNVLDHTPLQALNFYLCSILFENVLAKYAGPDRIGNLFCLRTIDAEDQYNMIKSSVKTCGDNYDLIRAFRNNGYKYSNINTVPIMNQGSMEFRVMRGTTDIDEIRIWAETLYSVREFAKQFADPVAIVRGMKEMGAEGLLMKAFGANYDVFRYPNWERDLLRNFIYVADMACARKAWDITSVDMNERKRKAKSEPVMQFANPAVRGFRIGEEVPPAIQAPVAAIQWDEDFEEEDM